MICAPWEVVLTAASTIAMIAGFWLYARPRKVKKNAR